MDRPMVFDSEMLGPASGSRLVLRCGSALSVDISIATGAAA